MALTATRAEQSLCGAVPGPRRRRTPREAEAGGGAGDPAPGTTPPPRLGRRGPAQRWSGPRRRRDAAGSRRPACAPAPSTPTLSSAQPGPGFSQPPRSSPRPRASRGRSSAPGPFPAKRLHNPPAAAAYREPRSREVTHPWISAGSAELGARCGGFECEARPRLRRPLRAAPASLGHLKETGPPAALLPAPGSQPRLPSSPPPSLGSTAASSRQEASLTPAALLSARTPPSRPRPLPAPPTAPPPPRPRFRPSLVPRLHRDLLRSAPGGHAPRRSHPGCPARCPFALLHTGIPSPSGSDTPSCQARSPGPLSCSVKINSDSRLKPCDVLATTLRICRVVKFLSTSHSRPVRKRPWPGSRDARPSGALSSLARRRGELACEPLVVCRQK